MSQVTNMIPKSYGRIMLPLVLVFLASLARLWRIDSNSMWTDEIQYVIAAKATTLTSLFSPTGTKANVHPPFPMLVMNGFVHLLGENELVLRLPAALIGILTVAILFVVSSRISKGYDVALLSAFLLSISPLHIEASQAAEDYSWLTFWTLVALYCLHCALQDGRLGWWLAYAFATAINFYTHFYSVLAAIGQGVFLMLLLAKPSLFQGAMVSVGKRVFRIFLVKRFALVGAVIALFVWPLAPRIIGASQFAKIHSALGAFYLVDLKYLASLVKTITGSACSIGSITFLSCVAISIAQIVRRREIGLSLVLTSFIASIIAYIGINYILAGDDKPERIVLLVPLFLFLTAYGAVTFVRSATKALLRRFPVGPPLVASMAVLLIGLLGWGDLTTLRAYYSYHTEDWRSVFKLIDEKAKQCDLILQVVQFPEDKKSYYLQRHAQASQVKFALIDNLKLKVHPSDLPVDVWWLFRTEQHKQEVEPGKVAGLKDLLGSEYNVYPFTRLSVIHRKSSFFTLNDFSEVAGILLHKQASFDLKEMQPGYVWSWLRLGDFAYSAGNLTGASQFYDEAINAAPKVADSYILLGSVRRKQGRLDEALRLYGLAIEINPPYGVPRMLRWSLMREVGDEEGGKAGLQHAIGRLGPKWIEEVAGQLTDLLVGLQGEVDIPVRTLRELQYVLPNSGRLHVYMGRAFAEKSRQSVDESLKFRNLAEMELKEAEHLMPQDSDVRALKTELAKSQELIIQ
jgi:uncharacterized membrane protein/tetratricopeptide (TPR) repeat protein